MISKTHISAQQPRRRKLNAKVCGCKSAIFLLLSSSSSSSLRPLCSNNDNSKTVQVLTVILSQNLCLSQRGAIRSLSVFIGPNSPWPIKLFTALTDCRPLRRTPFSNVVRMRTRSLVPKLKTTVIGLGVRLAHVKSRVDQRSVRLVHGTVSSSSSGQGLCCAHHLGKALHLPAYISKVKN